MRLVTTRTTCRDTLSLANAVKQRLWACVFWGTSHSDDQFTTDFPHLNRTYPSFLMKRGGIFLQGATAKHKAITTGLM